MNKKVLIVCYYWPPAGGPGVQRWLKFVKYLPEFGIYPIVFVPENPSYAIVDEELLNEIPSGVSVIKNPIKEPYRFASLLSRKQTKTISSGILPKEEKQSFIQRLFLYIRGNFFIPDARVSWVKPSVKRLRSFIEEERIDTIITTGPPHSLHLIGLGLKKQCYIGETEKNLHWIADFRDPWTTIGYHDKLKMSARAKSKHLRLEKEVLQTADCIVVTSPSTQSDFENITEKPVHLITNGFDSPDMESTELDQTFSIAHIGSLLSDRNPEILWEVLQELIAENDDFAKNFQLKLAGKVSEDVIDSIKDRGLEKYMEVLGYISHNDALRLQRSTQVLLLIEIDSPITRGIIPGKLFEYLDAGRPILAIGPSKWDVAQLLSSSESGTSFEYRNKQALKTHVLNLYNAFENGNLDIESKGVENFHRKTLTSKLAEIMHSLT